MVTVFGRSVLAPFGVVSLILGAVTCDSDPEGAGPLSAADKIDGPVAVAMRDEVSVPVLILGQTQLLEMPDGFREFAAANAGRARRELRDEVVAELKEIAASEGSVILSALGSPDDARRLWLVNAIIVSLSPEAIEKSSW